MRISDWSSDVCSSDLRAVAQQVEAGAQPAQFELHPLPAQVGYAEGNELIAFGAVIGGRGAGAERDEARRPLPFTPVLHLAAALRRIAERLLRGRGGGGAGEKGQEGADDKSLDRKRGV